MQLPDHPRVLLVEDDLRLGYALSDALEAAGAQVDGPYTTLSDAMSALAQDFPDFALLDLNLGGQDSLLVAQDLKRYGIAFAFYSGATDAGTQQKVDGAPFFHKPLDPAALLIAIHDATHH